MPKIIHLISDLHLCDSKPQLLALFEHYMRQIAPRCEQLYVLGDLFEVWVGDDFESELSGRVITLFDEYVQQGGQLFLGHGNRDFLLGDCFAAKSGATLIQEPHFLSWQQHNIGLMHGDSLCLDDTAYQEFRQVVRDHKWQADFLSKDLEQRLAIADGIREQSMAAQLDKSATIMDVNESAVKAFFEQHQIDWLIHGHTHREGEHRYSGKNNSQRKRIVLSDWGDKGHYLELSKGQANSLYFGLD